MRAIFGLDPFKEEKETLQHEYDFAAQKVRSQDERIYKLEESLSEANRQVHNYQDLTENQRKTITDKQATINDNAKEYEKMIQDMQRSHQAELTDLHEQYEERLRVLREDLDQTLDKLQTANKAIAKEMLSQSMLIKTNNGLEDLCAAMATDDVEKMKMATQYLDWSSPLVRIAQYHLRVLIRRNELVEMLHNAERMEDENVNYE